jgi:glycosyltransferase involved in cell wall biosynthesis
VRILFIDQFNAMGGAQQCLLELIARLPWTDVHAAIPGEGPLSTALHSHGVRVHALPEINYTNGRKTVGDVARFSVDMVRITRALRAIIVKCGIELLYVNGPRVLPAASLAQSRGLGCRMVFHAHNFLDRRYTAALCNGCIAGAKVIACSRFVASRLRARQTRVIYSGARPLEVTRLRAGPPLRIAMVGRIAPEKGQLDFVRAVKMLEGRGVRARYCVYGAPLFSNASYADKVRSEAAGLPIDFAGWKDDVTEIFSRIDLLAVPSSRIDAAPRVVLEAFSAGVPVIAYPSGGIPELIEDGVSGMLTRASDPGGLADAIEIAQRNPILLEEISCRARERWRQLFTLDRYAREVVEFISE